MSHVEVTTDCTACGACLPTCPERCLVPVGGRPPLLVIAAACTGCLLCVEVCPADAIDVVGDTAASGGAGNAGALAGDPARRALAADSAGAVGGGGDRGGRR